MSFHAIGVVSLGVLVVWTGIATVTWRSWRAVGKRWEKIAKDWERCAGAAIAQSNEYLDLAKLQQAELEAHSRELKEAGALIATQGDLINRTHAEIQRLRMKYEPEMWTT